MPTPFARVTFFGVNVQRYDHSLLPQNLDGPSSVQQQALTQTHVLGAQDLDCVGAVEQVGVGITHIVAAQNLAQNSSELSAVLIGQDHENLVVGDLDSVGSIEQGGAETEHHLLKEDLDCVGAIQSASMEGEHVLECFNLDSVGAVEALEITQLTPTYGTYVATPIGTVGSDNIYDENDVLAGADAHESVSDQTDTRWLRAEYGPRNTSYAHFSIVAGLPGDVTELLTMEGSFWLAMLGTWVDDPMRFAFRFVDSDGQPLTETFIGDNPGNLTDTFTQFDHVFTQHEHDPDLWAGARFELQWEHDKLAASDNCAVAVSQIYIHGDYEAGYSQRNVNGRSLIEAVKIAQHLTLAIEDLNCVGTLQSGSMAGDHILEAQDLDCISSTVEAGAADQTHAVDAVGVDGVGSVQSITLSQTHELACSGLDSVGEIEQQPIGYEGTLNIRSLIGESLVGSGGVGQSHLLGAYDLDSVGAVQAASVVQHVTAEPQDLDQVASLIESVAVGQEAILQAENLDSVGEISQAGIGYEHVLAIVNLESDAEIEPAQVASLNDLTVANLVGNSEIAESRIFLGVLYYLCPRVYDVSDTYRVADVVDRFTFADLTCEVA